MDYLSLEMMIDRLDVDVYPITIMKYILNRGKILYYFSKAKEPNFVVKGNFSYDPTNCEKCKIDKSKICRDHTTIDRIFNSSNKIIRDLEMNVYLHMNEIFKVVNKKLVVIYCPHTKLIGGDITRKKIKMIRPITFEDERLTVLPEYGKQKDIMFNKLLNEHMGCWFNNEFTIISIPRNNEESDFCLVPNN